MTRAVHGTRQVEVPWARPDRGFTLLFEALLMEFAPHMPVAAISRVVGEHDTRIWRVLEHYVAAARVGLDLSQVTRVGVDESSARQGRTTSASSWTWTSPGGLRHPGPDSGAVGRLAEDLIAHRGDPGQVASVTCDMSQACLSGVNQHLPQAEITYDRYHMAAKLNEAVAEVRWEETGHRPELAASRYLWIKERSQPHRAPAASEDLAEPALSPLGHRPSLAVEG